VVLDHGAHCHSRIAQVAHLAAEVAHGVEDRSRGLGARPTESLSKEPGGDSKTLVLSASGAFVAHTAHTVAPIKRGGDTAVQANPGA
jgi:hypothetical protein